MSDRGRVDATVPVAVSKAEGHTTCTSAFFLEDGWWAECMDCDWRSGSFARHDLAVNAAHDHTATTRALTTEPAPQATPPSAATPDDAAGGV